MKKPIEELKSRAIQMLFKQMLLLSFMSSTLFMASCGTTPLPSTESIFFVENTSIDKEPCKKSDVKELEIACHRLVPFQTQLVIANRLYERGYEPAFTKLTISIPETATEGDSFNLPSSIATVFYSTGFSYMPGKSGCYGFAQSGTILIKRRTPEIINIEVNVNINTLSPLEWPGVCKTIRISRSYSADRKAYGELSAWDGVRGKNTDVIDERVPDFNASRSN